MPEPTTAEEWADYCDESGARVNRTLCLSCATAYARQWVEAFREKVVNQEGIHFHEPGCYNDHGEVVFVLCRGVRLSALRTLPVVIG